MAQHWQELLPVDRYSVAANGLLYEYDRKTLTFLYQPLIGSLCYSLYMTLWAEIEESRLWSQINSHHSLMNFLNHGLKDIYDARLKLEGIGLLKTYVKTEDDNRSFIYELQPPLTPEQFFLDGMLNIYLYRKIGKTQYGRLKRFFSDRNSPSDDNYKSITRSFQDVFTSLHPSYISSEMENDETLEQDFSFHARKEQIGIKVENNVFNFELLMAGLQSSIVTKKAFNPKVMDAIQNLSFLYGIDAIQMKNIVISAVTESDEINIEELRKSARDWYQFEHNDGLPSLVDRIQPSIHQTKIETPKTKEEELLLYLETSSPRQVLKDISGGVDPSKSDLQIIEDVMFQQKLLPGVVNVLIQYVMLRTDMKLSKAYIDKIAGHWVRKKIKTAKEAMDLAKKEHQQYLEWAEGKNKTKTQGVKKQIRTEVLPEWFNDKQNDTNVAKEKKSSESKDFEKRKKELEERLKKYKS